MNPIPLPPFPLVRRRAFNRSGTEVPGEFIDPPGTESAIIRVWLKDYRFRKPNPALEHLCRAAVKLPEIIRLLEEMDANPDRLAGSFREIDRILDSIRHPAPVAP